jgi:hypothetical protein
LERVKGIEPSSSASLAPLIADVVKTIEPLAAKNSNKVAVHCAADMGTMHADQMRLRQALLNLMRMPTNLPSVAPSTSMGARDKRTAAIGLRWLLRILASG